jgi:hypothetical protein
MAGNANDVVNNLNGTLTAVTVTADRNSIPNEALYFNGTGTCHVELPDNPLLKSAQAVSFSAWIRSDSLPMGTSYILYTNNGNFSDFEAYALITFPTFNGHRFRVVKADQVNLATVDSSTPVTLFTWYHVVFTMSNTQSNLYVNGILENTTNYNFGFAYVAGKKVYLGATNESQYYQPFKGAMDNIRFYNRVLNAAEASALYNTDPRCLNEVLVWENPTYDLNTIRVYPSETEGQFEIETNHERMYEYIVQNSIGQILKSGHLTKTGKTLINMVNEVPGIYIFQFRSENKVVVKKVIKN